jgi:diguanylate cyclase (GGDEF)-like protein
MDAPIDGADENPTVHNADDSDPAPIVDDQDRTAEERDQTSDARDRVSAARDDRAEERDERAGAREDAADRFDPAAASDRAAAKRDRQAGAGDRKNAEDDRHAASSDRALSARQRALALIDQLTGARRREAGLIELEREIIRAKRTQHPFVLAFVDVDHLKQTNDALGHTAGDQLLREVVATIRHRLRPYDLIVRYGGDEFLCGLLDLGLAATTERFALVNADLTTDPHASISVGLAELLPDDTLDMLISRADAALYIERKQRADPPG